MMQKQKLNWHAVLLAAVSGFSALLYWGVSLGAAWTALPGSSSRTADSAAPLITASSTGFMGLLLLAAGIFSFQKLIGRESADRPIRLSFTKWHIPILILAAVAAVYAGNRFSGGPAGRFLLPIMSLAATIAPLWLFLGFGVRQMGFGPRWRAWGIFSLGLTLGPFLILFLEITLLLAAAAGFVFYVILHPELGGAVMEFSERIQAMTDPDELLRTLSPFLLKPAIVSAAYGYTALLVPMIEELLKPIGVWLFARQLKTPGAGFVMGILSGAAYALIENMGVAAQAGPEWAAILSARAATGLLHITTTGLMGWAIVALRNEKEYVRFLISYFVAVSLHGLWNGAVITVAIYTALEAIGKGKSYQWLGIAGALVIGTLIIVHLIILITSNHVVRTSAMQEERQEIAPTEP